MKVLWLTNIPSPYRVKFFNELGKKCKLTVLFEKKSSSERDDSWKEFSANNFTAVFLQGKNIGVAEAVCPSVVRYINKEYDHIVVTNYSDPTGMIAISYMKSRRIHYEIEGDGAFPVHCTGIKKVIKRFLLSGADRYFSTAKMHDKYYQINGVDTRKIVRYPFTSVYQKEVLRNPITYDKKCEIREQLGMSENKIILAVGQFIPRKGFDVLINSARNLKPEYGVYIVGGTAPEQYTKMLKNCNNNNVHFVEFKRAEELEQYYLAADIFVHPTREDIWGLVINEALSKGLPVVTTDHCIAGLEMIESGVNGEIVPVGDKEMLYKAICNCIVEASNMRTNALHTAEKYTIENMAQTHVDVWNNRRIDL